MGRTQLIAKYEITEEIKELQRLAMAVKGIGYEVNIDITQDLVTINGYRKMTRAEAKAEMLNCLESNKTALGTNDFADKEAEEKEAKRLARLQKKHREPGAPPELKQIFKRAKRIFKKSGLVEKSQLYIDKHAKDESDKSQAHILFNNWMVKNQ